MYDFRPGEGLMWEPWHSRFSSEDMTGQQVFDWDSIVPQQMVPGVCEQVIACNRTAISRVEFEAGSTLPTNSFPNEKIAVLLSGRMLFTIGANDDVEVLAGQVIYLPAHVKHGAIAAEDSVILDVH